MTDPIAELLAKAESLQQRIEVLVNGWTGWCPPAETAGSWCAKCLRWVDHVPHEANCFVALLREVGELLAALVPSSPPEQEAKKGDTPTRVDTMSDANDSPTASTVAPDSWFTRPCAKCGHAWSKHGMIARHGLVTRWCVHPATFALTAPVGCACDGFTEAPSSPPQPDKP